MSRRSAECSGGPAYAGRWVAPDPRSRLPAQRMASRGVPVDERRARRNVVMTAAIAGLGGLLFGYDTGIIASALLFVKSDFHLSGFEQGMVVSAVPIGAVFGAAIAGQAADR